MKNLIAEKNLIKAWNLRFAESIDESILDKLTERGGSMLDEFFATFPNPKNKFFCFVNSIIDGNKLFNLLANSLLEENKLKSRCLRIGAIFNYLEADIPDSDLDLVLFDNLELTIFSDYQKHTLIQVIDGLYNQSTGIFLNIPTEKDLNCIPNSLKQLIVDTSIKILENYGN